MLIGKEVNVYKIGAAQALEQKQKPLYKGKVVALSSYQANHQEELYTLAVVMLANGVMLELPLYQLQVIIKK